MIKMIALMKRKPGMTLEEFIDVYENGHAPFAAPHLPHAIRYERRYLKPLGNPLSGAADGGFDVLTEVWFADREAMAADLGRIATPEVTAAFDADEARLFDPSHHRLFVIEHEAATELGRSDE